MKKYIYLAFALISLSMSLRVILAAPQANASAPHRLLAVDLLTDPNCAPSSPGSGCVTPAVCDIPVKTVDANKPEFCRDDSTSKPESENPIYGSNGVVTNGIRIFVTIFGVVAIFVLLINAVRMITSMGDPKSFESARNGIIYAAVGLAVAISANIIVSFIVSKL